MTLARRRAPITLVLAVLSAGGAIGEEPAPSSSFSRDIAPIVFDHCAGCHRPGESGPFNLLTYGDVRKRGRQIVQVTRSGYMPPWLPDPGYAPPFVGQRYLTEDQIGTIRNWVREGMPEGDPADLPQEPDWPEGWQLGEPDLVVEMASTYVLAAEGFDIFRNFVIPVPPDRARWVRTVELRPGNARIVHHAVMMIDRTQSSRRHDARDDELGFGGMSLGDAERPGSQPIPWTPGMAPSPGFEGVAWRLDPGSDVVLQMHMLPSGKPEEIRPAIGFHFANQPPTRHTWSFTLHSEEIDIPPGESSYVIEDRVTLPAPVEVVSVYPHAHYLGKDIQGYAVLPDGSREWLVRISDWDFNWQDEYRYKTPVLLPAGSTVVMHYTYDNSADNPRNPTIPPKRVTHGTSSLDEMGTLSFEVIPQNEDDLFQLQAALSRHDLELDPDNWFALNNLGIALERAGDLDGAAAHLRRAIELMPSYAKAHHNLGVVLREQGRSEDAIDEYRLALKHNPLFAEAYVNLANALASRGDHRQAAAHYAKALQLNSHDSRAHFNMALTMEALGRSEDALNYYREAAELDPNDAEVHNNLGSLLASAGDARAAIGRFRRAVDLDPTSAEFLGNLGTVLLMHGMIDLAIERYRDALKLDPSLEDAAYNLEAALEMQAEAGAAIRAAEDAVRTDRRTDPMLLARLAASYADAGRFAQAIDTAQEALARAEAIGDAELAHGIEGYLDSWRAAALQ